MSDRSTTDSGSHVLTPLSGPPDATPWLPGSKSLTNRAVFCAAFAEGDSDLSGVLFSDDTHAMIESLVAMGATIDVDTVGRHLRVRGLGGPARRAGDAPVGVVPPLVLDARLSGTTSRFLLPALCASVGSFELTGGTPLLVRPFAPQIDALRELGADITHLGAPGMLPVRVEGSGLAGGLVQVESDLSSQFASGLMLAGPLMSTGLRLRFPSRPVSLPYLEMTQYVMQQFGATIERVELDGEIVGFDIAPGAYRAASHHVEPDASAASYFMAAAAATGGSVRIAGLHRGSAQGDVRFADVLARMGADVRWAADAVTVTGSELHGVDVDMRDISDTAQTLAAVAALAEGTTRVTGIGFIRGKETDRIAAVVRELQRVGIDATEDADGFTIVGNRGGVQPGQIETYDDHRMAMSFAILGLVRPGIEILDPGCVAKTFPTFFEEWAKLDPQAAPG